MFRRLEWFLALRYLRARRGNGFISFIALISMLGIAVGVAVLVVVLSVMNGFEYQLRERILHMTAHATLSGPQNQLDEWSGLRDFALRQSGVRGAAPYVEGPAMLLHGNELSSIVFRGIDPALEQTVADLQQMMLDGGLVADLATTRWQIILGQELALALDAQVGDEVSLTLPQGRPNLVTGFELTQRTFTVSGIFRAGMYEYDRSLALIHLGDAQSLYRYPIRADGSRAVTGLRLRIDDLFAAGSVARRVALTYDPSLIVNDWARQHLNLFRSIQLTKSILFVILLLVVAVAAFNIVSTLVMVVRDKRADIAILRTQGAVPRTIHRIFVMQGTMIGLAGTAFGVALGAVLAWNLGWLMMWLERLFGIEFLASDVYPVSDLIARVDGMDLLQIAAIALLLSLLSALYPAWRAARTHPAEALRHD